MPTTFKSPPNRLEPTIKTPRDRSFHHQVDTTKGSNPSRTTDRQAPNSQCGIELPNCAIAIQGFQELPQFDAGALGLETRVSDSQCEQ
jgi:hypothetical protein